MKKLSIITINYNNKNGLEDTIKSVVNQTHKDFEYIVIDGGSTDGSKELLEKYSDKITYWVSEPDKGIYNAMNKGILQATGEYLLFLNSGDYLYSNEIIEKILPELNSGIDIYYGDVMLVYPNKMTKFIAEKGLTFNHFRKHGLPHQSSFIKKELFNKYGLYDETLTIVSDWKFFIITICKYNVTFRKLEETISYYDMNGISAVNNSLHQEEREIVLKKEFPMFIKNYNLFDNLGYNISKSKTIQILNKLGLLKWITQTH